MSDSDSETAESSSCSSVEGINTVKSHATTALRQSRLMAYGDTVDPFGDDELSDTSSDGDNSHVTASDDEDRRRQLPGGGLERRVTEDGKTYLCHNEQNKFEIDEIVEVEHPTESFLGSMEEAPQYAFYRKQSNWSDMESSSFDYSEEEVIEPMASVDATTERKSESHSIHESLIDPSVLDVTYSDPLVPSSVSHLFSPAIPSLFGSVPGSKGFPLFPPATEVVMPTDQLDKVEIIDLDAVDNDWGSDWSLSFEELELDEVPKSVGSSHSQQPTSVEALYDSEDSSDENAGDPIFASDSNFSYPGSDESESDDDRSEDSERPLYDGLPEGAPALQNVRRTLSLPSVLDTNMMHSESDIDVRVSEDLKREDGSQTDDVDSQTDEDGSQTDDVDSQTDEDGSQTDDVDSQTDEDGSQTDDVDSQTDEDGSQTDDVDSQTDDVVVVKDEKPDEVTKEIVPSVEEDMSIAHPPNVTAQLRHGDMFGMNSDDDDDVVISAEDSHHMIIMPFPTGDTCTTNNARSDLLTPNSQLKPSALLLPGPTKKSTSQSIWNLVETGEAMDLEGDGGIAAVRSKFKAKTARDISNKQAIIEPTLWDLSPVSFDISNSSCNSQSPVSLPMKAANSSHSNSADINLIGSGQRQSPRSTFAEALTQTVVHPSSPPPEEKIHHTVRDSSPIVDDENKHENDDSTLISDAQEHFPPAQKTEVQGSPLSPLSSNPVDDLFGTVCSKDSSEESFQRIERDLAIDHVTIESVSDDDEFDQAAAQIAPDKLLDSDDSDEEETFTKSFPDDEHSLSTNSNNPVKMFESLAASSVKAATRTPSFDQLAKLTRDLFMPSDRSQKTVSNDAPADDGSIQKVEETHQNVTSAEVSGNCCDTLSPDGDVSSDILVDDLSGIPVEDPITAMIEQSDNEDDWNMDELITADEMTMPESTTQLRSMEDNKTESTPIPMQSEETQLKPASPIPMQLEETQLKPASRIPMQSEETQLKPASPIPMQLEETQLKPASPIPMQLEETQLKPASPIPMQSEETQLKPVSPILTQPEETQLKPASPISLQPEETQLKPVSPIPMQLEETQLKPVSPIPMQSEGTQLKPVSPILTQPEETTPITVIEQAKMPSKPMTPIPVVQRTKSSTPASPILSENFTTNKTNRQPLGYSHLSRVPVTQTKTAEGDDFWAEFDDSSDE